MPYIEHRRHVERDYIKLRSRRVQATRSCDSLHRIQMRPDAGEDLGPLISIAPKDLT